MTSTFTITGSVAVSLTLPSGFAEVISENVGTILFSDNSFVAHHTGHSGEQLVLNGMHDSSDVFTLMASIRSMMDNRETVAISGLPDSNFNSDYRIVDLQNVRQIADGYRVRYTLTLERLQESS